MDCEKCHHNVAREEQLYCNGLCKRLYHAACVGLNNEELAAVSPPKRNSFWLCDDCFSQFLQWRESHKEPTDQCRPVCSSKCVLQHDVDELKSKVEEIMSVLASNATCSSGSDTSSAIRHSTPRSSPQLETIPNRVMPLVPDVTDLTRSQQTTSSSNTLDESFALLLTNIDANVSEEDVQRMVSRCLGACDNECKHVRKLVPRWVDCDNLDYVSFKVVLSNRLKSSAMRSSTWPKNVKFREFVRKQCTWKPDIV